LVLRMDTITPDLIRDAESAHTTGRMSGRNPIEVLVRADRRRSWTAEQKREIVMESLDPEQRAADVARKHGITTGQLYTWRRQMVTLRTEAPRHLPRFASVELSTAPPIVPPAPIPAASALARTEGLIEIVLPGDVLVRVDAHVDGRALRRVLGALAER
jgi:transposase